MARSSNSTSNGLADSTRTSSVARLTLAFRTPGTAAKAFSTRPTQDAQLMPSTRKVCVAVAETGVVEVARFPARRGWVMGHSTGYKTVKYPTNRHPPQSACRFRSTYFAIDAIGFGRGAGAACRRRIEH